MRGMLVQPTFEVKQNVGSGNIAVLILCYNGRMSETFAALHVEMAKRMARIVAAIDSPKRRQGMSDLYEADVAAWAEHQAALLRRVAAGEHVNEQPDWANIIDEVETVGRSERAALRSHIAVVLEHLIKLQASPATAPRRGWMMSVLRARVAIKRSLKDSPSLRPIVAELVADEIPTARSLAASALAEYGEQATVDVDGLTYTEDQVVEEWLPE